ncbi:Cytosolic sulfotransferase 11 [Morella rubra]|uniref:Sulfotransferase n=1 Tax=Morella rubra TaxID=262757 RepID=A0A6A1UU40_9ROSI|nr:Cytosolic sulfotransferase 11 [Morella rubra]
MGTHQPSLPPALKYLKEDKVTEECKDLMRSLPSTDQGFLYQYQGSWIPAFSMQGVLSFHKHFQAHDTDILLVTSPKVGTTWLKSILFSLLNRARYDPNAQRHPLLTNNPHKLVPFLEIDLYSTKQVPDLTSFTSPRLLSTHLPYSLLTRSVKDSMCKIVYLCRNPKDTFVSMWHFRNSTRVNQGMNPSTIEQDFDNFSKGISPYGPYWDHVMSYWKESLEKSEKVFVLEYEKMKEQPTIHLKKLAEFLECAFSPEEEEKGVLNDILKLCSFENLSNLEVNKGGKILMVNKAALFHRGEVGDWMNHLTPEMSETLDRITEEKFHSIGLKLF